MSEFIVNACLMGLLAFIGIMVIQQHRLFAVIILSGAYSLSAAAWFVIADAVDVAFTEAAVGAGVSTVLALATLSHVPREEKIRSVQPMALTISLGAGLLLLLAVLDMPHYGSDAAPVHNHVAPHYIEQSGSEIGVPNIVTSVLASYRGFDTLGETAVIFTAAIAVFLILTGWTRKKN
jgi:multicomponent Na+:H+ antiporter subunit B